MESKLFIEHCKELVFNYYKFVLDGEISLDDIYVVWLTKALQNNKALLSTTINDTRYFEVTYNGDKNEIYFDSYLKEHNACYKI